MKGYQNRYLAPQVMPPPASSSSSTPTANLRLGQRTRTRPSGNNPVVYRQQMGFSPPPNQPRRNLQQRITESRNRSSQTTTPHRPRRPRRQDPDDNFTYDSDFEHNRDT